MSIEGSGPRRTRRDRRTESPGKADGRLSMDDATATTGASPGASGGRCFALSRLSVPLSRSAARRVGVDGAAARGCAVAEHSACRYRSHRAGSGQNLRMTSIGCIPWRRGNRGRGCEPRPGARTWSPPVRSRPLTRCPNERGRFATSGRWSGLGCGAGRGRTVAGWSRRGAPGRQTRKPPDSGSALRVYRGGGSNGDCRRPAIRVAFAG
jgi:hypothetical protein